MHRLSALALGATALLAVPAHAQCGYNVHPLHLVSANGTPAPIVPGQNNPYADPYSQFADESVYVAFDASMPSGTYYVHVTNLLGSPNDEVLSTNDPMDRFVTVANNNGVISLSLPFTSNPNPTVFGTGLNGVGQSLLVAPFRPASVTRCEFVVWAGDTWDTQFGSEWPYIVRSEFNLQLGRCSVASYGVFRVGDGSGSDVSGNVFLDADHNGSKGGSENGVGGVEVQLVGSNGTLVTQSDANGNYNFANVDAGSYSLEVIAGNGYVVAGSSTKGLEVCGCADISDQNFGLDNAVLTCNPRAMAFWRHNHGLHVVNQNGILSTLPSLQLVNMFGHRVAPGSLSSFRWYLIFANSWNMAYRLSAELLVTHCNVMAGYVDPMCVINDPALGQITIGDLMVNSITSLAAHPFTLPCSQHRAQQTRLKNALLNANKNRNWL